MPIHIETCFNSVFLLGHWRIKMFRTVKIKIKRKKERLAWGLNQNKKLRNVSYIAEEHFPLSMLSYWGAQLALCVVPFQIFPKSHLKLLVQPCSLYWSDKTQKIKPMIMITRDFSELVFVLSVVWKHFLLKFFPHSLSFILSRQTSSY